MIACAQVMLSVAARQLHLGLSVVMDCPMSRIHLYRQAQEVARQVIQQSSSLAGIIACMHGKHTRKQAQHTVRTATIVNVCISLCVQPGLCGRRPVRSSC